MLQASRERVTPEIAKNWLENANSENWRALLPRQYMPLAAAMSAGRWVEDNGDTITFDDRGVLVDGQHRLTAVVISGKTVWMLVVRGASRDSAKTKDTGVKRTTAGYLKHEGYKNTQVLSSACRWVYAFVAGGLDGGRADIPVLSTVEVLEMAEQYGDIVPACAYITGHVKISRLFRFAGAAAFCYAVAMAQDEENGRWFFDRLNTAADMPTGSPVLLFYRRMDNQGKGARRLVEAIETVALFLKAWNLTLRTPDIKLNRLIWTDEEPFPSIGIKPSDLQSDF